MYELAMSVTAFLISAAVSDGTAQGAQGNSSWSLDPFLGTYTLLRDTARNVSDFIVMLGIPEEVAIGPTSIEFTKTANGTHYQQRILRSDPRYNLELPFVLNNPEAIFNVQSLVMVTCTFTMIDQFTLLSHMLYTQAPNITVEFAPSLMFKPDASQLVSVVDVISPRRFQTKPTLIRNKPGPY